MKKIILSCLVVVFLVLPIMAEINFEQIHETLQTLSSKINDMENVSRLYQDGKWRSGEYTKPFTAQEKETLKNDWIDLKNEVEALWGTLPED